MAHILILGGGFGGVAAARRLRDQIASEHQITLIDRRDYYMIGFRKTWGMLGQAPVEEGQRKLAELARFGIRYIQGSIDSIDPAAISVVVDGNMQIKADAMIVALGAELAVDAVPGFAEHALNAYDPARVADNAAVLRGFQGGRVLVGVFGLPYKCPPAPYELAILLKEKLAERGADAEVTVFTPLPNAMPLLTPEDRGALEGYLLMQDVRLLTGRQAAHVERGQVHFTSGDPLPFDLLLGIAPHRAPEVVRVGGLTGDAPWVPVNPLTFETRFSNVFAIGDVTQVHMGNGSPLPKAGVFAEGAGMVVADRLAAVLAGRPPTATFEGRGGCFFEVGAGQAVLVQGNFMAPGGPHVGLTPASEGYVEEKWTFERERLVGWFD